MPLLFILTDMLLMGCVYVRDPLVYQIELKLCFGFKLLLNREKSDTCLITSSLDTTKHSCYTYELSVCFKKHKQL